MKNPSGCAVHSADHFILIREIVRANGVMEEVICARIIGVVSRRDENHWQAFGIGTSNSVECRKGSNVKCHDDRSDPIHPGIAFSSIRCIELIATADLLHMLVRYELTEQTDVQVT